jgi:hypothetical protein
MLAFVGLFPPVRLFARYLANFAYGYFLWKSYWLYIQVFEVKKFRKGKRFFHVFLLLLCCAILFFGYWIVTKEFFRKELGWGRHVFYSDPMGDKYREEMSWWEWLMMDNWGSDWYRADK